MNIVEIANGAKALLDGFGEAPPPQAVSQARADICSGRLSASKCPANFLGGWAVTTEIARAIHAQRQKKLELNLSVQGEERLGTCTACRCALFLKVHYDSATIYNHTTDETFNKMRSANPQCWIAALQNQHQTT